MTATGADFNTQQYRHGVLIGNWNEDQFGVEHIRGDDPTAPPNLSNWASIHTVSFSTYGHQDIHRQQYLEKSRARVTSEVNPSLLFSHRGGDGPENRYKTQYTIANQWRSSSPSSTTQSSYPSTTGTLNKPRSPPLTTAGQSITSMSPSTSLPLTSTSPPSTSVNPHSLTRTEKMRLQWSLDGCGENMNDLRNRDYRTQYSDVHHVGASTIALPVGAHQTPFIRQGMLDKTFESSHRTLRLRRE